MEGYNPGTVTSENGREIWGNLKKCLRRGASESWELPVTTERRGHLEFTRDRRTNADLTLARTLTISTEDSDIASASIADVEHWIRVHKDALLSDCLSDFRTSQKRVVTAVLSGNNPTIENLSDLSTETFQRRLSSKARQPEADDATPVRYSIAIRTSEVSIPFDPGKLETQYAAERYSLSTTTPIFIYVANRGELRFEGSVDILEKGAVALSYNPPFLRLERGQTAAIQIWAACQTARTLSEFTIVVTPTNDNSQMFQQRVKIAAQGS